jgi:hypothetical protein
VRRTREDFGSGSSEKQRIPAPLLERLASALRGEAGRVELDDLTFITLVRTSVI